MSRIAVSSLPEAHYGFGGPGKKFGGPFHRFIERQRPGRNRENRINSVLVHGLVTLPETACNSNNRHPEFPRDFRDTRGGFTEGSLAVDTTFTGDYQIRSLNARSQTACFRDNFDAGSQDASRKSHQPRPETARRTRARHIEH